MKRSLNRVQSATAALCVAWTLATAGADTAPPGNVWTDSTGCRWTALPVPGSGRPGFASQPAAVTGVQFTNQLAQHRQLTNQILLNGSGVAAGDVDGDGWCDLYFCGLDNANVLYRNVGNWRFEDITAQAGVACPNLDASGAAFADLDGDGDLDLVVNSVGAGTHVFLNDGRGHFSELVPPLNPLRCGTSIAVADIDGDGALDLYIANYRAITIRDQPNTRFRISTVDGPPRVISIDGRPLTEPDLTNRFTFRFGNREDAATMAYDENGEPDLLLRNIGGGRFEPLSWTGGTFLDEQGRPLANPPFDWGLSAMFRDLNGDGAPDLYVCNDFRSPDHLWFNDGHGRFRAAPLLALRQTPLSSMGVDFTDVNRDGLVDFFVVDMLSRDHVHRFTQRMDIKPEILPPGLIDNRPQYPRNALFLNRGDGTWAEIAQLAGIEASEWSWTPLFIDVDLDGYEDLLVSNGFERDGMNVDALRRLELAKKERPLSPLEQLQLRKTFPRLDTPNLAFRNRGDLTFEEISAAWGFHDRGISQGMALADLDNDGDLDVIVNNLNAPASLYRNASNAPRIAVRLKGAPPNTRGVGARIRVLGGPVPQSQEMICGGRYLSCDEAMRVFAAGSLTNELTIEVAWRSGRRSVVTAAKPNRLYEIEEPAEPRTAQPEPRSSPPESPLFTDASQLIRHVHHENLFDDFAAQPTLPKRLSQLGPGVAWFDLDSDGWDDLVIPSGKEGIPAVFLNDGHGGFVNPAGAAPKPEARLKLENFQRPAPGDQTTALGWRTPEGHAMLLVGTANDEGFSTRHGAVHQFDLRTGTARDLAQLFSPGPLALADVDGDGWLDLFVGGRVIPRRYPEPASSLLFRGTARGFEPNVEASKTLAGVGLVSAAAFSDLDGDGLPDLVLACEWGPLKLFRNVHGKLTPWNPAVQVASNTVHRSEAQNPRLETLAQFTGLWTGVTTGDFDGDGRLDIVAGNWGRNTRYERFRARPLHLFYGALSPDGLTQAIEGYEEAVTGRLLPLQPFHVVGLAMPALRARLGTFEAYASRSLPEIYGDPWNSLKELQATWLDSTLFLNRGDHFLAVPLPVEAQWAPAFALCAADFDCDGREDLFLSQNFFSGPSDESRLDAGRGLLLRGDGRGDFAAVPGQASGILVYGEQRGAATCDYDADGRVDLVVAQNGAQTKLLHNSSAKPGLRVRLRGSAGNPDGIGAALRAGSEGKWGPVREVHAGSGYWSQDSTVQVLAMPPLPAKLEIRWPGGRRITNDLPAGAREIIIDTSGNVSHVR